MKIFDEEEGIKDKLQNNRVHCDVNYLIDTSKTDVSKLAQACVGHACAFSAIKDRDFKITDDVMPISSVLVTDIWNANGDVFTAEEIVKAEQTPNFKPINWMHRGSEDSQNENIGVMVQSHLIYGDLPEIDFMDEDNKNAFASSENKTLSGKVHIKQDGVIWAQYFPTYANKIKDGISKSNLYVSMECFFEDFGYCLRKNEDDENPIFIDRTKATSHMSEDLRQYGGTGFTKYNGKKYQIGRWLKNIIFSGQGIVVEPANKRKGKILSIIINNAKADVNPNFDPNAINPPTGPVQEPGAILNPNELPNDVAQPTEPMVEEKYVPKTYEEPADGLLFYSPREAEKVAEIELGCTGYHLYQANRHGDNPLLYAKLLGDPSDLEDQMKIAQYRPCADEQELRFVLQDMAKKGFKLRRYGRLSENQQTSVQPSAPGGGGSGPSNQTVPTSDTNTGLPGGQDQAINTNQGVASENLIDNITKVYTSNGDKNMSDVNEQEIESAITAATETIEKLRNENAEYEAAIIQATEHIEKLNSTIAEFEEFASSVEAIADKVTANKLGENRMVEMKTLLGEDLGMSKEELSALDSAAYSALKSSVTKLVSSITSAAEEMEKANAAAASVAKAKKPTTNTFVVAESEPVKQNPVDSLIGFAMAKKR